MNNIYLTEAYAIDNKSILRILTQNKQINKSDPNYSYYSKLATWTNENGRQQKLKNIDLTAIQLSDKGLIEKRKLATKYTTLGHLLNDLKNLMDQDGKYTPSSELSRLIQQTTLDILSKLSNTKASTAPEEAPENREPENENEPGADKNKTDEPELYEGMDWAAEKARRLEAGGTPSEVLDKFYNDYYLIEYAGGTDNNIVAKLKSLDKILIPEFNALGYNPDVNPFAQFLKILIDKKPKIFNKLTTNTYGAIHNSFIATSVTGNMLGNYSEDNILFCNDLYNHNGLDIIKYLSLQNQALQKAKTNTEYSAISRFTARLFIRQKTFDANYEANIKALFKEAQEEIIPASHDTAKLKSLLEVRELYKHIFKSAAKKSVDIKEIISKAKDQNVILDMINLIINQTDFIKKYPDDVKDMRVWLIDRSYRLDNSNIDKCVKILTEYTLNARSEYEILTKLVSAYEQIAKEKKSGADS